MGKPELGWHWADRPDRSALSTFECANPVKALKTAATGWTKPFHPRQWEYDAQRIIRALAKKIPPPTGTYTLVNVDEGGLAAVASWSRLDGPGLVHLDVMAIANRHRGHDGRLARDLGREVLYRVEAAAIEAHIFELWVECEVYRLNTHSLALCVDMGLTFREEHPTGSQTWGALITLEETLDLAGLPTLPI